MATDKEFELAVDLAAKNGVQLTPMLPNVRKQLGDGRTKQVVTAIRLADSYHEFLKGALADGRNQLRWQIYLYPYEFEPIFKAVKDGLVNENVSTAGELLAYLATEGVRSLYAQRTATVNNPEGYGVEHHE